jgi:hypothetical protein
MESGEQVKAVVWVLVRNDDCIDHVRFDREGSESSRAGVTPDPG